MYKVWADSESEYRISEKHFETYEVAYNYAQEYVHRYDGCEFRAIAHIDHEGDTVFTVENIIE